jgi:hypothetical protein
MSDRLEQFIRGHREEFDDDEPGKKVWEDIRLQLEPKLQPSSSKIIRISPIRWSAAAAIVLVIAGSIWYFQHSDKQTIQPASIAAKPSTDTLSKGTAKTDQLAQAPIDSPSTTGSRNNGSLAATAPKETKDNKDQNAAAATDGDATINEEMYHYARLVELKHKELKTIEKDEPLLYRQFAADVHSLDSVYLTLQQQLPKNPNREQLLEAMLQNLQLQMGLLNHQLDIIKQINHSKKTAYEKAYKTV